MEKNAAMTVVANALFAQSYSAHDTIDLRESFIIAKTSLANFIS